MKLRTGIIFTSALLLLITLFYPILTFAQTAPTPLDYVKVSAYGADLEVDFPNIGSFIFTVADLPQGSVLLNSIEISHEGETSTINLTSGERVSLIYTGRDVISISLLPASEENRFEILYEGQAVSLQINADFIPEFPSIVSGFIALIGIGIAGILYKKKLKT